METGKKPRFKQRKKNPELGRGSFGVVYVGQWIEADGDKIPAACKEFTRCPDDFHREYKIIKELNHLFVIKLYGTWEIDSKRFEVSKNYY